MALQRDLECHTTPVPAAWLVHEQGARTAADRVAAVAGEVEHPHQIRTAAFVRLSVRHRCVPLPKHSTRQEVPHPRDQHHLRQMPKAHRSPPT